MCVVCPLLRRDSQSLCSCCREYLGVITVTGWSQYRKAVWRTASRFCQMSVRPCKNKHKRHIFMSHWSSVCIYPPAKGRAIAIPVDLDNQVNNLFVKSNNIVQKTAMSWRLSARNAARRDSVVTASRDYRNIIERLQVQCSYVYVVCRIIQEVEHFPLDLGHCVGFGRPSAAASSSWVIGAGRRSASTWTALPGKHRLTQKVWEWWFYMQVSNKEDEASS